MTLPLRDLTDYRDVKGGSPKTPAGGIPRAVVSDYQDVVIHPPNGVWRAIACGLAGLNVGLVTALFAALSNKGVTTKEMQEYVKDFSPYNKDVEHLLTEHNLYQDTAIGVLTGKQDKITERLSVQEATQKEQDRDLTDCKKGMKNAADFIEESRKGRK